MHIAILYICTGRYTLFWDEFYRSCEAHFLPKHERNYFVFTDGDINKKSSANVHPVEQEDLGWPGNTLDRFSMFSKITEQLAAFDYIFFFNANCQLVKTIDESILPSSEEGIVVVQHPGFYNKQPGEFTYDRNPASLACIPQNEGRYYVCGGINGGRTQDYLRLIDTLRNAVEEDKKNGVVALWHDESHMNKYILLNPHKLLPPSYCYPEDWELPFDPVILVRDKAKFGGHNFLRGLPEQSSGKSMFIKKSLSALRKIKRFASMRLRKVASFPDKLHLGCGWIHIPGFCNVDIAPSPAVDVLDDVSLLCRFPENYATEIYACHILEHFPHDEVSVILKRWYSVLKLGGMIRISVPDIDKIVKIYSAHWEHFQTPGNTPWIGLLYGGQVSPYDFHKTGFNFCWLKYLLEGAGFHSIAEYPHEPHFAGEITDGSLAQQPFGKFLSLNVIAYKH